MAGRRVKEIAGSLTVGWGVEGEGRVIMRPLDVKYIIEWDSEHLTACSETADRETDGAVDKRRFTLSALQRPSRRRMYQAVISMK